ncbi:hypothetical protein MKW92_029334, partial [Papaver armeniacum]
MGKKTKSMSSSPSVSMKIGSDGVAVVKFTNPTVKVLLYRVIIEELKEKFVQAINSND